METKKRKRSSVYYEGRDRLSEMPDEVLIRILSYMRIIDAVRTMLIRPFRNLWTLLPTLEFDIDGFCCQMGRRDSNRWGNDYQRFIIFVGNVLMLHKRPVIDEFRLYLGVDYQDGREDVIDDIRMWFDFALDKQAKYIYFSDVSYQLTKSSDLPNFISQSLVTLQLYDCTIYPQLQVDLGSLKKLIFEYVNMSEEAFQQFICGCPSLQQLRLDNPFGISNLSFSVPNIRELFFRLGTGEDLDDDPWLLDFPNLKSLHLELDRLPDIISIDVSSVQDVYLEAPAFHHMVDKDDLRMYKLFLENFSESEVLSTHLNGL